MKTIESSASGPIYPWEGKFLAQKTFTDIFAYSLNLPCFLLRADQLENWHVINSVPVKDSPLEYEMTEALTNSRVQYNNKAFQTVIRTKKTICAAHRGLYGIFAPVLEKSKCTAILQTGVFLKEPPTESTLADQWLKLTGRHPKIQDREFLKYVRTVLKLPVFGPRLLAAVETCMELYADLLTGNKDGKAVRKNLEKLNQKFISPELGHPRWVEDLIIQKKFFRFAPYLKKLMEWEKTELGLSRFPTTILAFKRENTGREISDIIATGLFQREVFKTVREMSESLSYPLDYYASLVLTSSPEEFSASRQKLDVRTKAAKLASHLSKTFKCKVFVGIGGGDSKSGELSDAYHEAVTALYLAETQNRPVLFFDDMEKVRGTDGSISRMPRELMRLLLEGGSNKSILFRQHFVGKILKECYQNPDAARRIFLETIHRLMEVLEERGVLEPNVLMELEKELEESLDSAPYLNEMVDRFERALGRLVPFLEQPATGAKLVRLRKAEESVESALQKHWSLPLVARQFRFSISVFSREFSRFTGRSFSDFLLQKRLEKARRLLAETALPLNQIAEVCGFTSTNYFLQIFKRKMGQSPGQYRRHPDAHKK